jgi:hypothetical protein
MALDYTLSNNYHSASSAAVGNHDFTISAWAKQTAQANEIIIGMNDADNSNLNAHALEIQHRNLDTDRVRAMSRASGSGATRSNATIGEETLGEWTHVAGIWNWDGSTFTSRIAYGNGVAGGTSTADRLPQNLSNTVIGARADGGGLAQQYDGEISHIAIWNVILTDDQILALANGVSPLRIQRDNLINYWPMGKTGTLYDIIQNLDLFDISTNNNPTLVEEPPITQFRRGIM